MSKDGIKRQLEAVLVIVCAFVVGLVICWLIDVTF